MHLFKMHLGLIKYLSIELRKKRKPNELVYFLRDAAKMYFKALIQEYKLLFMVFDNDYRQYKLKVKRNLQLKKDLQRALKLLQYVDTKMQKQGVSRQARRQFWRDFYRDGQVRADKFTELEKDVEGIK